MRQCASAVVESNRALRVGGDDILWGSAAHATAPLRAESRRPRSRYIRALAVPRARAVACCRAPICSGGLLRSCELGPEALKLLCVVGGHLGGVQDEHVLLGSGVGWRGCSDGFGALQMAGRSGEQGRDRKRTLEAGRVEPRTEKARPHLVLQHARARPVEAAVDQEPPVKHTKLVGWGGGEGRWQRCAATWQNGLGGSGAESAARHVRPQTAARRPLPRPPNTHPEGPTLWCMWLAALSTRTGTPACRSRSMSDPFVAIWSLSLITRTRTPRAARREGVGVGAGCGVDWGRMGEGAVAFGSSQPRVDERGGVHGRPTRGSATHESRAAAARRPRPAGRPHAFPPGSNPVRAPWAASSASASSSHVMEKTHTSRLRLAALSHCTRRARLVGWCA